MQSIVTPAIEAHRARRARPKFDPTEIRLSETGGCPRQQLLRVLGYSETHPRPAEAENLMETGDVWERILVEALIEHYGPDRMQVQIEITTPHGSGGHADLVVRPENGPARILDAKATKAGARRYLPKDQHVRQLQAYLHYYGRHHGITEGELVYTLRETGEIIPFPVVYDPKVGHDIEAEQAALALFKAQKRVPEVPTDNSPRKFPCYYSTRDYEVYCQYHGHCWAAKGAASKGA